MKKRILSILLILCMTTCIVPISVFAEGETFKNVASAAELKSALADDSVPGIRLTKDIVTDAAFSVTRTVTLDLNGYMLKMTGNDSVIRVEKNNKKTGDLTLIDSRSTTEHRFKADDKTGRWLQDDSGDITVKGGVITSTGTEQRTGGGGVSVTDAAKFTMHGGNIVGCNSDKPGSGVYVSFSTFTMTGGKIAGCGNDPGIYLEVWAVMNANGGEVDATVALRENSKITTHDNLTGVTVFRKNVEVYDVDGYGVKYGFFYVPTYRGTTREIVYLANGAPYAVQIMPSESSNPAVEPEIPTSNTGSTFLGWYKADGTKWDFTKDVVDDHIYVAARWDTAQQFSSVEVGKTYYFDLSGENIPGMVNANLPDTTLHYVPFTYAGTLDGYVLNPASDGVLDSSEKAANTADSSAPYGYAYLHSLFIADHILTTNVSYNTLNAADFIFGNSCTVNDVDYTLRAPTIGNTYAFSASQGVPENNEWDQILFKDTGFIKNLFLSTPEWSGIWTWGQDTNTNGGLSRSVRSGYNQLGGAFTRLDTHVGYRPVLEVQNAAALGSDGLRAVALNLGGSMLGGEGSINLVVKNGESFAAPSVDGLPRPIGVSENAQLWWKDGNGSYYRPGDPVPAEISELSIVGGYAVFYAPGAYGTGDTVTDSKMHDTALTLRGALFTRRGYTQIGWATADGGEKEYGLEDICSVNAALTLYPVWRPNRYTITIRPENGGQNMTISEDCGTALTAPILTRTGYTFVGWDEPFPATMPAENILLTAQWKINRYTITFDTAGGSEIASVTQDFGTAITAPAAPTKEGYTFIGWNKEIPAEMPAEDLAITALWKETETAKPPKTADGSAPMAWLSLLLTSGAAVIGTAVVEKRKKHFSK